MQKVIGEASEIDDDFERVHSVLGWFVSKPPRHSIERRYSLISRQRRVESRQQDCDDYTASLTAAQAEYALAQERAGRGEAQPSNRTLQSYSDAVRQARRSVEMSRTLLKHAQSNCKCSSYPPMTSMHC